MTDVIEDLGNTIGVSVGLFIGFIFLWKVVYIPLIEPWVNNVAIPTIENVLYGIVMPIILIIAIFVVVVLFTNWYSDNSI